MVIERGVIWPDLRASWIVYEDADVLAVDKPARVPTEPSDPPQDDDLRARLTRFIVQRDGRSSSTYLGVHHLLDAETSGLVLYARRREANAGLARQVEARELVREFVAAVTGWRGGARVLRHRLGRGEGARLAVVGARDSRGKDAELAVTVLAREADRTLLSCRIVAGGPLTLRTQLALEGTPIVGENLYASGAQRDSVDDAEVPPRLLLHARRLALAHPLTGAPLELVAEPPAVFDDWLRRGARAPFDDPRVLRERLADALEARYGLARLADVSPATTTFRLVNELGDGLPGVAVDLYGEHLVVHLHGDTPAAFADEIFEALSTLGFAGTYAKYRPKQANTLVDTRRDDLAPLFPVRGVATAGPTSTVYEYGLPLEVRLGDGLSTGLFLDQRDARRRVRELAADARVLNLFAYTCAFSAAAAAGNARVTVSVDASREVLALGERNVSNARALSGTSGDDRFVRADVFEALARLQKSGETFDLIIADPPTYATTHASRWTSGASWRGLAAQCVALLAAGGRLLASSNDRRLSATKFRRLLREGAREAGRAIREMKDLPAGRDFPSIAGSEPHLKSVFVVVE